MEKLIGWYKKNGYLTINQITDYSELTEQNFQHFIRILTTAMNDDYTSGILLEKAKLVFQQCKDENWSERDFSETLGNFVSFFKYQTWTPANFFEYYKPVKLYDKKWAETQLQSNPTLNIEHYVIPIDNTQRNFYCLADTRNQILAQYKANMDAVAVFTTEQIKEIETKEKEAWKKTEGFKIKEFMENNQEYKNLKLLMGAE